MNTASRNDLVAWLASCGFLVSFGFLVAIIFGAW
jgi:hypothetical protein